jgi:hypothetical protein
MTIQKLRFPTHDQAASGTGPTFLLYAMLGLVGLLAGGLIGIGQGLIVMLLIAMVVSVGMLAYPMPLMWAVLLGALVIAGPAEVYFPELRQVRWGISLLGFALIASAVLHRLFLFRNPSLKHQRANLTLLWLGVFFAVAIVGLFYNHHLELGLIGFKSYFQACGFFLALAWLSISKAKVDRLMQSLIVIAMIQFPFALHQFFFLGSMRIAATAGAIVADGVVGTFPGSAIGGGAGPVLSALLILVTCILLYWWRKGRLSLFKTITMVCICLVPVFLNETKISLIAIPLGLGLVFADKLKKSPLQFLAGSIATGFFLVSMYMVYINLPAGAAYDSHHADASFILDDTLATNVGSKGYGSFELNRTTIYTFWAKHHGLGNPVETLIGHGIGSSGEAGRIETRNLASLEYRGKGIGLTSISALLWDVGLVGAFAVVAMFGSAFRLAGSILARSKGEDVFGDGLLMGARVGIAILGLNLIHNNYFTLEFGYQTLVMLMFGYVAYRARSLPDIPLQVSVAAFPSRLR